MHRKQMELIVATCTMSLETISGAEWQDGEAREDRRLCEYV
jgi:hypothetical protein